MPQDNIWDAAIEFQRQKLASSNGQNRSKETSMIIVGSKGVGKSTLIHRLLEHNDSAKPTLALEYTFGRRTNQNLVKDVCHFWELGGGTLFTKLLETPLLPAKLSTVTAVIMLDLSQPSTLWFTLETLAGALQTYIQASLKSQTARDMDLEAKLSKLGAERIDKEHPDLSRLSPFPIPLVILGGKYDIFANEMESEKKKVVCKALRYFAHYYGASLQFYSAKESGSVKRARDLLNFYAFGTEPLKGVSMDHTKPIMIPAWTDSLKAILADGADTTNMEMIKHHFTTHFPQTVNEQSALPADPAKDQNFKEPSVDALRAQKDEDLERYRKDMERRARHWGEDFEASLKM